MAAGRLKIDIRRKRILELLSQNGQVTVAELSGLLNATQTTIRTDLDTMAAENRLVRIPGGAIAIPAQSVQTPVQEAAPDALAAQKRAIAAKVLSHIQDGDTLFLNSGSTTLRVAEALCARKRLCVVTNSIRAAEVLAGYPETHVVLLGGEINAIYGFTFGDDAVQQLGRYQPAWAILSVDGVNAVQGITTYHAEEAMVNRIMIQQAHRAIIAADRRKVGRAGFTGICRLDDRFTVITDSGAKPEELDESLFSSYLDSAGIPDPDLIIRPSGELRLSNFLLWQCAYSEFYYTDTLWPDFDEAELDKAIAAYQHRDRRFGGVKK